MIGLIGSVRTDFDALVAYAARGGAGEDHGETVVVRLPTGHALVRGAAGPARWRVAPPWPQAGEGAA